jgi:hypothetical protein
MLIHIYIYIYIYANCRHTFLYIAAPDTLLHALYFTNNNNNKVGLEMQYIKYLIVIPRLPSIFIIYP